MIKNFQNRIYTSIFLVVIGFFCILINPWIFTLTLIPVLFVCYQEWCKINIKYFKKSNKNILSGYTYIKIFGFIYILLVFITATLLRGTSLEQALFFTFIIIICIFSDVGGYLFGKIFRGPKLTKISPNKTISGTIGSFALSLLPIFIINIKSFYFFNFPVSVKNILFCILVSFVCQSGDLFISYFKRLNKVKDTGKILPGHGGLLDRLDGIIFVIPIIYYFKVATLN